MTNMRYVCKHGKHHLYERGTCELFCSVADHRVSHFVAENHLCKKRCQSIGKYFVFKCWNIFSSSWTQDYVKQDSHRKLVIVFTEVEHPGEDEDVSAWEDESVLDRL